MQVTYTNRSDKIYYLCRGSTKTGKPRYYFASEPRGEPVEQVPEGYEIRESVNGVVSLARTRPAKILPEEQAAVEAQVARHPKARNYRVDIRGNHIVVYERTGPDVEDLLPALRQMGGLTAGRRQSLSETLDRGTRFTPVMRFTLSDKAERTFYAERWCYQSHTDGWVGVGPDGPLRPTARQFIPLLSTDALFDQLW
jgi:hypothetical protein